MDSQQWSVYFDEVGQPISKYVATHHFFLFLGEDLRLGDGSLLHHPGLWLVDDLRLCDEVRAGCGYALVQDFLLLAEEVRVVFFSVSAVRLLAERGWLVRVGH